VQIWVHLLLLLLLLLALLSVQGRSIMGRWAAQIITQHLNRCVG